MDALGLVSADCTNVFLFHLEWLYTMRNVYLKGSLSFWCVSQLQPLCPIVDNTRKKINQRKYTCSPLIRESFSDFSSLFEAV